MLNVFITVDVEIWCDGWRNLDAKFPQAFQRYIYGPTPAGPMGLPFQVALLRDHGLQGVFFTEPLFAARFGAAPLAEIVGLLQDGGQEVQLHLHTEWVDEARTALLDGPQQKRQHLRYFSPEEQTRLIGTGLAMLRAAGAREVNAFRAGSFAFNRATLGALAANGLAIDASYNASMFGPDSGVLPGQLLTDSLVYDGIVEYPMTVFCDGSARLRHVQLTSCSWAEMEGLLWQALARGDRSFVILSHGFEMLNPAKTRADSVVVQRFRRLCAFLERHRDQFRVQGFAGQALPDTSAQPAPMVSPRHRTAWRMVEQLYRRTYQ